MNPERPSYFINHHIPSNDFEHAGNEQHDLGELALRGLDKKVDRMPYDLPVAAILDGAYKTEIYAPYLDDDYTPPAKGWHKPSLEYHDHPIPLGMGPLKWQGEPISGAVTGMSSDGFHTSPRPDEIPPADPSSPVEQALKARFPELVKGLRFPSLVVRQQGRELKRPEAFRLVSMVGDASIQTLSSAGTTGPDEPEVRCTYTEYGPGHPWLDTKQAVGLVKEGHLIAVAGAGIDAQGRMVIKQIQDVTGVRRPAEGGRKALKEYYATGLHDGFWWRDTLAAAWEELAEQLGVATIVVPSYKKNTWSAVRDRHNAAAYDDVADRRDYAFDEPSLEWVKQL